MIQLGDLPYVDGRTGVETGFQPGEQPGNTAHTVTLHEPRRCHKCGELVTVVAGKPGSPYVWCLKCW